MNAPPNPHPAPAPALVDADRPRFDITQLLKGSSTAEIDHAGQRYLLRVTRENKLILTK
jgi:hemin uptake protein HemP